MLAPAFQLIPAANSPTGRLGLDALGSCPLGGGLMPIHEIPPLNYRSDDLSRRASIEVFGPSHERYGAVVSVKTWAARARWRVFHRAVTTEEVEQLNGFKIARRFRLLPAGDPASGYYNVVIVPNSWKQSPLRRGLNDVEYTLEELT